MPVPSQEYDSCYPFVWCVWALDFAIWLRTFLFGFTSEFSIFVILLFSILFKATYVTHSKVYLVSPSSPFVFIQHFKCSSLHVFIYLASTVVLRWIKVTCYNRTEQSIERYYKIERYYQIERFTYKKTMSIGICKPVSTKSNMNIILQLQLLC